MGFEHDNECGTRRDGMTIKLLLSYAITRLSIPCLVHACLPSRLMMLQRPVDGGAYPAKAWGDCDTEQSASATRKRIFHGKAWLLGLVGVNHYPIFITVPQSGGREFHVLYSYVHNVFRRGVGALPRFSQSVEYQS